MPWQHPKRVPSAGEVMDVEGVDDALRPVAEGISNLTEHNLDAALATGLTPADLDTDAAWRYSYQTDSSGTPTINNRYQTADILRYTGGWQPVPGLTDTVTVRKGRLRVLASIQQCEASLNNNLISYPTRLTSAAFAHVLYAVAIDGAVVASTISGDVTPGQGEWMEMGRNGECTAELLDVQFEVAPGNHRVEIHAFVHRPPIQQAGDVLIAITEREMFAWELD